MPKILYSKLIINKIHDMMLLTVGSVYCLLWVFV